MMKIRLNFPKIFLLLSVFLFMQIFAQNVYAETWEYITHGGYDAAVEAWKRVALIFSHSGYTGLFTVAFIAGFFSLLAGFLLKSAFGLKVPVYTWLSYILAAAAVYLAFIVPKDSVIIYDETLNRGPYQVDNVPKLLATIAGVINKAENGMIELVGETSDPVQDYRYNPAGIAFNALGSVEPKQIPSYKYRTLYNYFKDCIVVGAEIGTYLKWDDLTSGRYTLPQAVTQAANPSLYTVVYNSDGSDYTASCQEASSVVLGYIGNISAFESALKAGCARVGYDPASTASYQMCKSMMSSSAAFLLQQAGITTSTDLLGVVQQLLFTDITKNYLLNNGPAALGAYLATQKTTSSFIGLGIHANSWIPELKESLSAVVIALTPLILLFLITPFALRVLSVLAGMLIWIAMWGVIDAVVFSFGLSMASASAKYLATGSISEGLGLFAASVLPNTTAKIYAIFGALRWSGLMLASVLTMMLVHFGGTALALLAGQIASAPMSAGAEMGAAMSANPLQTASNAVVPSETWANTAFAMGGMRNLMNAMASYQTGSLMSQALTGQHYSPSQIAGYQFAQTSGGIGNWERFRKSFSSTSFGAGAGLQDAALAYKALGGDVGKLMQVEAGLKALQKAGILSPQEMQTLARGGMSQALSTFEKYKNTGMLNVTPLKDKEFAISVHTGQGGLTYFYNAETGEMQVVDTKVVPNLGISGKDVSAHKKEWEVKNTDELVRDARLIHQGSYKTDTGKEFQTTFEERGEKTFEAKITEGAKRNKELQDFIKRIGGSTHELYTKLGAETPAFIKVGGGYEYKARHSSEKGIIVSESLVSTLQNIYAESEKEALISTAKEMEKKGYSREDVENFLEGIGAKHAKAYIEMTEYSETSDVSVQRELNVHFLNYYAEKYGLTHYDALVDIQKKLAKDPNALKEEIHSFLNHRFSGFSDWKQEVFSQKEQVKNSAESVFQTAENKLERNQEAIQSFIPRAKKVEGTSLFKKMQKQYLETGTFIDHERSRAAMFHYFDYIPGAGAITTNIGETAVKAARAANPPDPGTVLQEPELPSVNPSVVELPKRK